MSQDRILNLLMQKNEITWQTILHDLVNSGEVDAWDIDISILANKYLEIIRLMQESNLFISGKVILASAILLKIKSEKLITEDIGLLDNLMFPAPMEELDQFMGPNSRRIILDVEPRLTINTPQTRKKRVQIDDLISALERALEVNTRRLLRTAERDRVPDMVIPEKKMDITKMIMELYDKIVLVFEKNPNLTFTQLVPSGNKEDKIFTFVPLLHLSNQEKVELDQKEHFGEIDIRLRKKD